MNKKAVVYARVSTDEQAQHGYSLAAQIEAGRKYAEAHGFNVLQELVDNGTSGAVPFAERPAGALAWELLREGKAQVIVCQNVDRLSRDVVDLLVMIRGLLRAEVEVHCLDLGQVTSEYDIMLVIRGWQGSDERAKIRERSMRGRRQKLREGKVIVAGRVPYGYNYLRDERGKVVNFEIREDQAAIVRLIYQWYATGEVSSVYKVAKKLSAAGIPTPTNENRKRKSNIWNTVTVHRILQSPTYKGVWICNFDGEEFSIEVPAIIDEDTWELAQEQIQKNKRRSRRNSAVDYLLSGIIKCGCGRSMHGRHAKANGKSYFYYACSRWHFSGLEEPPCREPYIELAYTETLVWSYFEKLLNDEKVLRNALKQAQALEYASQDPKREELQAVETMIKECEEEALTLAVALEKSKSRLVSKTLEDKMRQLDERYAKLEIRQQELEATLEARVTDEVIEGAVSFAQTVSLGFKCADRDAKRRILDIFNARVTVKEQRVFLEYTLSSLPIELRQPTMA